MLALPWEMSGPNDDHVRPPDSGGRTCSSRTYILLEIIPSLHESFVCGDGGLVVVLLERLDERLLQLLHVPREGHERADGQPDQEQQD